VMMLDAMPSFWRANLSGDDSSRHARASHHRGIYGVCCFHRSS